MKPFHDVLLRGTDVVPAGLYQLQLLTAEQLTRLHYRRGSIKMVKARLKTLVAAGYVQSDVIPSRHWRTPFYYTLGPEGVRYIRYVESGGDDVPASWRSERAIHQHWLFVEHTLELNDVLISALLVHRDVPSIRLHRFEHERQLKRHPYQATWRDDTGPHRFAVIPDAFLEFYVTTPAGLHKYPVLVEHDRGTEEQLYFRRRIRAYAMLFKSGNYQQLFQTSAVTVAFTTFRGDDRIDQLRAWTRAELEGEPAGLGTLFRFASLQLPLQPRTVWREQLWRSPYDTDPAQPLLAA